MRRLPIKRIRQIVQAGSLLFFLYLFFRTTYPLTSFIPVDLFLRIDPLVALGTLLSGHAWVGRMLWSLVLLGATLLIGRFFCGWLCPMGTSIALFEKLFGFAAQRPSVRKGKRNTGTEVLRALRVSAVRLPNLKMYFLALILVSCLFGFSAFLLFDPLVLLMRTASVAVFPILTFAANSGLRIIGPLAERIAWDALSCASYTQSHFGWNGIALILFVGIVALSAIEPRFWCRNLCPLGALLSLFSRFGGIKRRVSKACSECGVCAQQCPMGAIPEDSRATRTAECIQCQTCTALCSQHAIRFGRGAPRKQVQRAFDPSKRALLASAGAGLIVAAVARTGASAAVRDTHLIRPPGALPEPMFLDRCVRCGACMKVCPTNGLQPSFLQSGIEGFWTPRLVARIGGCEQECNLCGRVCPTGALRDLPLEEKQFARIGTAIITRSKCLAWEQMKTCLVCDEACPYDAIEFREVTDLIGTFKRPFVIEEKCMGCGLCEQKCPVGGASAIRVDRTEEERLASGSYITEEKRRLREVDEEEKEDFEER